MHLCQKLGARNCVFDKETDNCYLAAHIVYDTHIMEEENKEAAIESEVPQDLQNNTRDCSDHEKQVNGKDVIENEGEAEAEADCEVRCGVGGDGDEEDKQTKKLGSRRRMSNRARSITQTVITSMVRRIRVQCRNDGKKEIIRIIIPSSLQHPGEEFSPVRRVY
jgi:hypothetical protein